MKTVYLVFFGQADELCWSVHSAFMSKEEADKAVELQNKKETIFFFEVRPCRLYDSLAEAQKET